MAIGILGGTFDPVHCGHVRLALEIREQLSLGEIRLMPALNPRLRAAPIAEAASRLAMLRCATQALPGLEVDDRELRRGGPTRTAETLGAIREEVGAAPLCFIVGVDAFARLDEWHDWERLTQLAHLVVAHRPGASLPHFGPVARLFGERRAARASELHQRPAGLVHVVEAPMLDISATDIRRRLANGHSIHCLVPPGVQALIERNATYPACNPSA